MSQNNDPFPNKEYQGQQFERADMTHANFNGVNLSNSKFWVVLENATFNDSNLQNSSFDDVNLETSSFENVNLCSSTFKDINLSNSSFTDVNLSNVEISQANLEGMKIDGVLVTDLLAAWRKSS